MKTQSREEKVGISHLSVKTFKIKQAPFFGTHFKIFQLIALVGLCLFLMSELFAVTNPVGGGILDSGLLGTYYSDTSFTNVAFTRRDIRIDFDWGELRKPGGSLSWTKLGQLGTDNYSIRWEGRLKARFSETYTIKVYADSVRIYIKPETDPDYGTALIDYWPSSDPTTYTAQTANYAFTAGATYDIKIEYREQSGTAMMRLLWSSPSTPEEVIQPTAFIGETPFERGVIFADVVLSASNWGENNPTEMRDGVVSVDENGWPTEDFSFLIRPQDFTLNPGTYMLSFKGTAKVRIYLASGVTFYSADGSTNYGSQAQIGNGYDGGTNTTTLRVVIPPNNGNCWPTFESTDRDGAGSTYGLYSGLTDVRMLRPTTVGGNIPHDPDEIFARESISALETFVTFRWNDVNGTSDANGTTIGEWAHRRPFHPNVANISYTAENHEYKILLSNHSGRDLYIQVPHASTDDYITKLAQLIRYGSDANGNPYTSEQADPVFPPLNPNLRVIVEYTNECPWNSAGQYPQSAWVIQKAKDEVAANTAIGQILNYDGQFAGLGDMQKGSRYFALRTVQISNIFRSVFGDDAMPAPGKRDPKIRPVLMYQYDNY
ncbi:MAG: PA14 domain-containing protein, partial [Candidatus Nanoarchaeia archaeon]